MPKEKSISAEILESICKVLGDQNTGSQIEYYLAQTGIADTDPRDTKWPSHKPLVAISARRHEYKTIT